MMPLNFRFKCERVPGVEGRLFRENGRKNYYVRLFIEGERPSSMDMVQFVLYELHPTFNDPKRLSKDEKNGFELRIWTWGFFNVNCQVYLKNGDVVNLTGYVRYDVD